MTTCKLSPLERTVTDVEESSENGWEEHYEKGITKVPGQYTTSNTFELAVSIKILGDEAYYHWSLSDPIPIAHSSHTVPMALEVHTPTFTCFAGLLSALLFINTLQEGPVTIHLYSPDKHFISQVRKNLLAPPRYSPGHCLRPTFEIELECKMAGKGYLLVVHDDPPTSEDYNVFYHAHELSCRTESIATQRVPNMLHMESRATLLIDSIPVHKDYGTIFRTAHRGSDLQDHLMRHNQWDESTFDSINWEAHGKAYKKRSLNSRIRLLKLLHDWLPIGKMRQRINPEEPCSCPSCDAEVETKHHLFCCPCPKREQRRRDAIAAISEFLDKKCTVSDLKPVLLQGLQGYFNDPNYQMPVAGLTSTNTWLVKGIESQNKIL